MQQATNSFQRWCDFKEAPHGCITECLCNTQPSTAQSIFGSSGADLHQSKLHHPWCNSSLHQQHHSVPSKSYCCSFWVEIHGLSWWFWNLLVCNDYIFQWMWLDFLLKKKRENQISSYSSIYKCCQTFLHRGCTFGGWSFVMLPYLSSAWIHQPNYEF